MDTCICLAESLCCPPETMVTLLISYTLMQNKKLKKKKDPEEKGLRHRHTGHFLKPLPCSGVCGPPPQHSGLSP